ncbi:hypothetical protein BGZ49_002102 [Haplosporangium sp. Z 27]|nr:hypothetical protein BGZ49_002102 [Haplosporangium sp. Z 27]
MACAPVATVTFTSRPADTTVTTFAAAVAAAATTSSPSISSPRSSLSSIFRSKQDSSATETLASSINNEAIAIMSVMDAQPELHSKNMIKYSSVISSNSSEEVDDLSSPMGTSVDSNTNEVFDADEMELQHSNDPDSHMAEAETVTYPLAVHTVRVPNMDSDLKLERKSHLRRKVDRLRAKNAALKSTVTQVKCDLSLERQKRLTMDQIYQNIKKDLNKRLDSEEIKVLNLKAELEQMAAELKKVKSQLATAKAGASAGGKGSSLGYKIGYDSRSFSLSSGISNIGGLMLHHHSNLNLIGGQDDSEEFLHSHSYSPVTVQTSPLMSTCSDSITMSCSDSENEDMDDEEQSEEDEGTLLFTQTPNSLTSSPRRASNSSSSSLPILVEEESEEEESEDDDSDDEQGNAPRTMMEIIMCQQARSPEDDMEDPPADANETFETMAQKALYHAILLKFTAGQAHLQLEELALKYNARLEQVVDVIVKELTRWWEDERIATGGPTSGGWGTENVVINKETGELANPKTAIEKRVETFFGPLLLQLVASLSEQKMLLEKLGNFAKSDARWLKNHNSILVALCKSEVVETKAVLEWWRALEQPQGVFGHGGNDLRSLNSRFVAWLEDEEDDSESEDDDEEDGNDYDFDSCSDSDDSDDDSDEDDSDDDDDMEQDEDNEVEAILDMAYPSTTINREDNGMAKKTEERGSKTSPVDNIEGDAGVSAEPKRRISFCTNNLYYSNDGRICSKKDSSVGEDGEKEHANKKKYQQCPPYRAPESEAEASDTEIMVDEDRTD